MKRHHLTEANLRLFLVLGALLAEGSATRAAARLGVAQSAVSHALRRLRGLYGGELLVRGPQRLVPTPLAEELAPALRLGLSDLERALNREVLFDPATGAAAAPVEAPK